MNKKPELWFTEFLKKFVGCVAGLLIHLAAMAADEKPNISVELDLAHPGAMISTNFTGLSFEGSLLLPNENGVRYFRPDNQPLINLFHTLGVKSLRIGGNTSDRDVKRLPEPADLDSLFAFATKSDVKVIYCLQLHKGNPQVAAQTVKYIMDRYAPLVDSFSIGQEPSAYPVTAVDTRPDNERMGAGAERFTYSAFATEWKRFADAILAAVPETKFCGPAVHKDPSWARNFIADFGRTNHVSLITEHLYAGGAGGKVPTPEIGRTRMLSDEFTQTYQSLYDGFVPMSVSNGLPYRLEEVNNYYNGGATNVSNTFASALWGLDFMHWWAEHGATGLNFHTGDRVAAGSNLLPSKYTAFVLSKNGYEIRPLSYAIKAFELGGHGRIIAESISNPEELNVSAYAVLEDDQKLYVTVINKENGAAARKANLEIKLDHAAFNHAQVMRLSVPGNDVAASLGQTLGAERIRENGHWDGKWTMLKSYKSSGLANGLFRAEIPATSAVVVCFNFQ
jgi:hypothetical protein